MKMISGSILGLVSIFLAQIYINTADQPLCIVRINEDPILKIESPNAALKMSIPHSAWYLCPESDEADKTDNIQSTVTKNALFVKERAKNEIKHNSIYCKKTITPMLVKNKLYFNVFEIGYEIYENEKTLGEIHDSQSNENIELYRHKTAIRAHMSRLIRSAAQKQHWISVLKIKIRDDSRRKEANISKQITYDILNADHPSEIITCKYYSGVTEDLFSEYSLAFIFGQLSNTVEQKKIKEGDPNYPNIKYEFLVPKNHLNAFGRQNTACAILNVIPMWTEISEEVWSPLNDRILETAVDLGRLQIIAGFTGIYLPRNSIGEVQIHFEHNGELVPMPRLLWRMIKYTLPSPRYNTKLNFAIIIVTHNYKTEKGSENRICECICKENGWPVIKQIGWGMTYCCPANEEVFAKLHIEKDEHSKMKVLNLEKVQKLKEKYENFRKSFFSS